MTHSRHRRDRSRSFSVSGLTWRPGLSLLSYESSLRDFACVGQFLEELHFGTDRAERVGIEVEDAQCIIRQLFIDHFEIEVDIGGETPGILRGDDRAARALKKPAIAFHVLHLRETHETEKPIRLLCGHWYRSADPVGESNRAAGLNDVHCLRNQPSLVEDIAPSVLAPNEVCGAFR